jgi:DNA polymerase III delta prime subunit
MTAHPIPLKWPQIPLAEAMRPKRLSHVVGQTHLLGAGKPLAHVLNSKQAHSMILWGPPGVGKTTVGKILAELYCSLGFLKSNNFKIADRSDLIGGYLGQTAIKTKKVLKDLCALNSSTQCFTHKPTFNRNTEASASPSLSRSPSHTLTPVAEHFPLGPKGYHHQAPILYSLERSIENFRHGVHPR